MRKWGLVITVVYAVILLVFLAPAAPWLVGAGGRTSGSWPEQLLEAWRSPFCWVPVALLVIGQALLVLLTVDRSERRLRPRSHVLVSAVLGATLTLWLAGAMALSIVAVFSGDDLFDNLNPLAHGVGAMLLFFVATWALWFWFFYVYSRRESDTVEHVAKWLLRGSVLGLLIAVPCHVIVRKRNDCSAPAATGFGIASGIAIMLMTFGPGILWAYKRRLEEQQGRNHR